MKARENNRSKTMNGFLPFLTGDKVLLHPLPTFLAGISADGGDSQLRKQKHNCYFIGTTAISLAQLQIST
jgi:hypothetical protein